uniref:Fatty acid desaturase n=1 Tax=Tetraselmis sp. GSL018 TaxID=582737 RepID=A0A061QP33_9CHLO
MFSQVAVQFSRPVTTLSTTPVKSTRGHRTQHSSFRPLVVAQAQNQNAVRAAAVELPPVAPPAPEANPWSNGGNLEPSGEWRRNLDLKGWASEIRALEKELRDGQTEKDDVGHLKTIITWSNVSWIVGLALCSFTPVSSIFLSTAIFARWTMIGHHVCHGGYNQQQSKDGKITGRFHRRSFALGLRRRVTDWLDWMKPEAWDVEHNNLHHYKLGEKGDPDLVERNFESTIRSQKAKGVPVWLRFLQLSPLLLVWKWYYYAPNTLKELEKSDTQRALNRGKPAPPQHWSGDDNPATFLTIILHLMQGKIGTTVELAKCLLPYGLMMFAAIPGGVYLCLGAQAAQTAFASVVLAELLTNLHSFCIIATNHAGEDIYKFDKPVLPKSDEFYLRAVIGSTNFHTGSDFGPPGSVRANAVDFMQGWLNYQIEHHLWPDLSMLSLQKGAPRVRAICEKYGVPYVQEPVWTRVKKTVDVMTGETSLLSWDKGQ